MSTADAAVPPGAERLAPYCTRNVRHLANETLAGHRIKAYALEARGRTAGKDIVTAARDKATEAIETRAERFHEHCLGFLILHAGEDAYWLLVHRWIDGGILCRRLFSAALDSPLDLVDRTGGDLCFCVWEAAVVDFERRAFVDTMMREAPEPQTYLSTVLNGPV